MRSVNRMIDYLSEANPNAARLDGLDLAIIGVGQQWGSKPVLAYSAVKIIAALREQGMSADASLEWYEYNIMCLHIGDGTPFIVDDLA